MDITIESQTCGTEDATVVELVQALDEVTKDAKSLVHIIQKVDNKETTLYDQNGPCGPFATIVKGTVQLKISWLTNKRRLAARSIQRVRVAAALVGIDLVAVHCC